ncbi:NAD-dependent epimerase/dehydratase family protein [Dechloromonas agitata]|uniref:NAD-dependent epimerase/dehydratase family protein n=1 Tax=Dechloromonas agitata TaxID=73030 RepID=UPI000480D3CF|nr:NAD-dependent epimerase/dehydratase family protein [Dechloromonas agitata]
MILVTGGAGYIGSHTCVELLNTGHELAVFDYSCISHARGVGLSEKISGRKLNVVKGDISDQNALEEVIPATAAWRSCTVML